MWDRVGTAVVLSAQDHPPCLLTTKGTEVTKGRPDGDRSPPVKTYKLSPPVDPRVCPTSPGLLGSGKHLAFSSVITADW